MAAERRTHEGLVAAWLAHAIGAQIPFNETRLDPNDANPFREPDSPAVARIKQFIEARRWRAATMTAEERDAS